MVKSQVYTGNFSPSKELIGTDPSLLLSITVACAAAFSSLSHFSLFK